MLRSTLRHPQQKNAKIARLAAIVGIAALALTGCSTTADTSAESTVDGGDLQIVLSAEPTSLNPDINNSRSSIGLDRTMVESLAARAADQYTPSTDGLATGWEQIDEVTWEVTVREGVTFQNGEEFNAEVAVWNILRSRDDSSGSLATYYSVVADAVAIDETTFQITTTEQAAYVPGILMITNVYPPEYYDEVGAEEFGRSPIGTGPFEFDEWTPGVDLTVTKYADYWDGEALVDSVTFAFTPEESTRSNLLQTGQADIASGLSPQTLTDLSSVSGIVTDSVPTLMKLYLFFNLQDPSVSDPEVRRAIAMSIDTDTLVDAVFEGTGAEVDFSLYGDSFASSDDDHIEYDPAAAAAIVEDLGDDLEPIAFHWPVGRYSLDDQVGEAISGMLESVGFTVERDPLESGAFFDSLLSGDMTGMHLLGGVPAFPEEGALLSSYFTSDGVVTYCSDGVIDADAAAAMAMPAGEERDAIYNEIEEYLVNELICPVPLYQQSAGFAWSDSVEGFIPDFDENWSALRYVSLAE